MPSPNRTHMGDSGTHTSPACQPAARWETADQAVQGQITASHSFPERLSSSDSLRQSLCRPRLWTGFHSASLDLPAGFQSLIHACSQSFQRPLPMSFPRISLFFQIRTFCFWQMKIFWDTQALPHPTSRQVSERVLFAQRKQTNLTASRHGPLLNPQHTTHAAWPVPRSRDRFKNKQNYSDTTESGSFKLLLSLAHQDPQFSM